MEKEDNKKAIERQSEDDEAFLERKRKLDCEFDSFWDCHTHKAHCKKHFRI